MTIESARKEAINRLGMLATQGLYMGAAYMGLKPLLDGNPAEKTQFMQFVVNDAFPLVDEFPWPLLAAGVCFGALAWQITKRIPKKVGAPRIKPGSWVVPIGKTYHGRWVYFDLSGVVPHLLFCGSTKFGKTSFIKTVLYILCQQIPPEKMRMVILDMKGGASFSDWLHVPHVLDVKMNPKDAVSALKEAEEVMWQRLDEIQKCRAAFKPLPDFPHLFIVIDEGMRLSDNDEAMEHLLNIASIGREPHVHLLYGTQRPSHEILPVTTRDQMEGRFVFHLNERTSSEIVLGDESAYEMKRKPGLMIHRSTDGDVMLQSAYVDDATLEAWLKSFLPDEVEPENVVDEEDVPETSGGTVVPLSLYRQTDDWGD